jgi:hypothetical protein
MSLTRRQMLSSGAAAIAGTFAKPAIAAKEPIQIGYLPALTGPSSSTGLASTAESSSRCRRSTRPAASTGGRSSSSPATPKRPDQGRERRRRAHARTEGERRVRPGQFRRVACGSAAARTHQHAADPSLLGRRSDRSQKISNVLPQSAHQSADRGAPPTAMSSTCSSTTRSL